MTGPVAEVAGSTHARCHATRCEKDGCSLRMNGAPKSRVIVDLDCEASQVQDSGKRCDYLFVGKEDDGGHDRVWVAPIELKSGAFRPRAALEQLEGGADMADGWLPHDLVFEFVPVLAHGKGLHRNDLKRLRSGSIALRGQRKKAVLVRCGARLADALGP